LIHTQNTNLCFPAGTFFELAGFIMFANQKSATLVGKLDSSKLSRQTVLTPSLCKSW